MEFLIALLFSLLNIPIAQADGHAMSSRPEYGLPSAARVQYGMPYAVVPPEASRRLTTRTTPVKAPVPAARTAQAKPTPAGAPIPAPKVIAATAKASPAPAQTFTAPAPAPTPALQPAPVLPPAPQPVPEPIAEPKTSAVPAATPIELGALERYILIETNAVRVQNGLGMLVADGRLSSIARAHSADMLSKEYFAHTNLAGCSASCRMTSGGYGWQMMGENLYWLDGYEGTEAAIAKQIVEGWMNSAGHRANLLNASFTTVGIGVASNKDDIYATANYALPK